ncbi:MAG: hypothetical protein J6J06_07510 [Bacteroidaceae bacterium]|nr:hypothetical protein [Bacteroidaceae bacterium]
MKNKLWQPTIDEIELWGVTLLSIPLFALLLATVTFILGGTIEMWIFPTAIILSLLCGHRYLDTHGSLPYAHLRFYLCIASSIALALLSSALIYDYSYDGNTYHQESVIAIIKGCNPIHTPEEMGSIWSIHYAKALEIIASTIAICFNRIECGKAVNILLILSCIFITHTFLKRKFSHLTQRYILLFTILITLSPTVISQAFTYYNDFALHIFTQLIVISLIEIYQKDRPIMWCVLAIVTPLAIATKFTIALYALLTIAIAVIWYRVVGRRQLSGKLAGAAMIMMIIGLGVVGYHPYITNTIGWGNPFYPLIGGHIDIMSTNTPEIYYHGNRVTNWLRSLFYNAQGSGIWIPFFNDSLKDYYIAYDNRIAGFGPLFGYILFIATTLFATTIHHDIKQHGTHIQHATTHIVISLILILSCFIFEQSWWIRYIPFLWATPSVMLLYTHYNTTPTRATQAVRNTLYAALITTQLLCCATTLMAGISYTQRLGGLYQAVNRQSLLEIYSDNCLPSFEHKLQERNIKYEVLNNPKTHLDTTMRCVVIPAKAYIYTDSATYNRMQHPDILDFITNNR